MHPAQLKFFTMTDDPNPADAEAIGLQYVLGERIMRNAGRMLEEIARQTGEGYSTPQGLHIYRTQSRIDGVPDPEILIAAVMGERGVDALARLTIRAVRLLDAKLRKRLLESLDDDLVFRKLPSYDPTGGDGLRTVYGQARLATRKHSPAATDSHLLGLNEAPRGEG